MLPDFLNIAKNLFSIPRLISKPKKEFFGLQGVADIMYEISTHPDDHTIFLKNAKSGKRCAVCNVTKTRLYFHDSQASVPDNTRICKYCTWKVKERIDIKFREKKGLPLKEIEYNYFVAYRDYSAEVNNFLKTHKSRGELPSPGMKTELKSLNIPEGYYGPSWLYNSSNFKTEEYYNSLEYKEIFSKWNNECTLLIEFFLAQYGMFALAFIEDIELLLFDILNTRKINCRFLENFVFAKIDNIQKLFNLYANDFNNKASDIFSCEVCDKQQSIIEIKPELIRWTDGVVLPLCNKHWNTLSRALYPLVIGKKSVESYRIHMKDILGDHICPVCNKIHSWKDRTYDYTDSFYSIPPRFREICFDCLDLALNHNPSRKVSRIDLEGVLKLNNHCCRAVYFTGLCPH